MFHVHSRKRWNLFVNIGPSSQGYGVSSSHVWTLELDYKESWALKNWCFWTVVLEKALESPLDWKEILSVHPKGDQSWVFIGRTYVEAETPILWPPDEKSWLIWKDPDAGKDWGQEEKGDNGEWDGWMASPTQWTWVWVNSGCWWWTGRPHVLQFMGFRRVTELNIYVCVCVCTNIYENSSRPTGVYSCHVNLMWYWKLINFSKRYQTYKVL